MNIFELWQQLQQVQLTTKKAFSGGTRQFQADCMEAEAAAYEKFRHAMDMATKQHFDKIKVTRKEMQAKDLTDAQKQAVQTIYYGTPKEDA